MKNEPEPRLAKVARSSPRIERRRGFKPLFLNAAGLPACPSVGQGCSESARELGQGLPELGQGSRVYYAGFTLLELLLAMVLMATAVTIAMTTFYSISKAWQRGTQLADSLNHGDYAMEQIAVALRSAFYPPPQTKTSAAGSNTAGLVHQAGSGNGFLLEKRQGGAYPRDILSWVKTGPALIKANSPLMRGLQRVQLTIEDTEDDTPAAAVRAWRPYCNLDTFNPDTLPPFYLSEKIMGLNCRVSTNFGDNGWQWEERWENDATNRLPQAVEITLYLEPQEKGEPAVELKRLIEIPVAPLSWRKRDGK